MRALIPVIIATASLAACQEGTNEHADEPRAMPPSAENRILDPGGAMSDPNTRIMIAGNQSAGSTVKQSAGSTVKRPLPQPPSGAAVKAPPTPSGNAHEGH